MDADTGSATEDLAQDANIAPPARARKVVLGDEAVALGAVHAGISAAYAYPGTPSTEIVEYLIAYSRAHEARPLAAWCANEKTAYEEALGVSFCGKRALVAMKHVGLNVAADPFMNSALVSVHGGLVIAVADDPGMHSSQNEQDSRVFSDFARIICLEPANQQEAYDMTREAFEVSERLRIPVMIRLVTRIAHSRAIVEIDSPREENMMARAPRSSSWILLPVNARRQWRELLDKQQAITEYGESGSRSRLWLNQDDRRLGVITTGIGRNYFMENRDDLPARPSHLHIGAYPAPRQKLRQLVRHVERLVVIEEGYPIVEGIVRGLLPPPIPVSGKMDGTIPLDGELTPESARLALGLPARTGVSLAGAPPPARPPQLCSGCPHAESFHALTEALASFTDPMVTSDIGCYTLGALPPYSAIQTCVCMGASVSMAKGAADAGYHPVVAVIGDSTFLHSGITPLIDAAAANSNMTLIVLDNETVGMTGGQPTMLPVSRLTGVIQGLGVAPDHLHVVSASRRDTEKNVEIIRREIAHSGLSVIIAVRECVETAKRRKRG